MKKFPGILLVAAIIVLIDQLTKHWFLKHFTLGESRRVFSFLYFTLVKNTGTAFGQLQGHNHFLLLIAFAILGTFLYFARGLNERYGQWAFWGVALVIGGAIGNIIDRYTYGQVIDFLDFRVWPVFNIADSAITVGVCSLVIGFLRND